MSDAPDPRIRISLDSGWRFFPGGLNFAEKPGFPDGSWRTVSVPHTWNAADPFDDDPSYRRGVSWYRRIIHIPSTYRGKKVFLYFEGVNQVATIYVNGAFAGHHKGGYTAFAIDATSFLRVPAEGSADNLIAVQVDNSHDPFIPPLSVGYALYGGIYRDVWLVVTDRAHFSMTDHGSQGVSITMPDVSTAHGAVRIAGSIVDENPTHTNIRVTSTLFDSAGLKVAAASTTISGSSDWLLTIPAIPSPKLWSPERPYLYSMVTEIRESSNLLDRVTTPLGFRWFSFDPVTGFFLNGKRLQLRGTNRHQDYQGLGSALPDSLHVRDLEWIKKMGANFVRLAHYPQDPAVLEAADRLGLLIWEEIPVVNYITPSAEFTANSEEMLREMIRQHRNHPSVIMWGIMNEVFLWSPQGFRIGKQVDSSYTQSVRTFAKRLDSLARIEDPARVTTMAVHGSGDYDASGVSGITQVLGQNVYSGWYSGVFDDFGKQLDRRRARFPNENIFVSEYGAEDDARVNSLTPERFDFSGAWMKRFHESYLRQINARPWLAGTAIWSQFDFSQPETGGSIPYMNQKGMLTWDRTPKDVYYLYKANWNPEPMVYIASRGWVDRLGSDSLRKVGSGPGPVSQPVDVYSNAPSVELLVNGKSLGLREPDDVRKATWNVPFNPGANILEARAGSGKAKVSDRLQIQFTYAPLNLRDASIPWRELAVNLGSHAQVHTRDGSIWDGDREYHTGSFGYVGGTPQMFNKDLPITFSTDTPLLFTYRAGLKSYRFDVPDGDYVVELRFAEPVETKAGSRVFTVSANGTPIVSALDLAEQFRLAHAAVVKSSVSAKNGDGLQLEFLPIKGDPILNAIRIRKQ